MSPAGEIEKACFCCGDSSGKKISNELIVDKTSFKVICSFLREKDEWKLNDINDKVNLLKLLTQKLVYEE
jgi:hypothetical protein